MDRLYGDIHKGRLALISTKAAKEAGIEDIEIHGSDVAIVAHEVDVHGVGDFARTTDRDRNREASN